jgi:hypothetical protein
LGVNANPETLTAIRNVHDADGRPGPPVEQEGVQLMVIRTPASERRPSVHSRVQIRKNLLFHVR